MPNWFRFQVYWRVRTRKDALASHSPELTSIGWREFWLRRLLRTADSERYEIAAQNNKDLSVSTWRQNVHVGRASGLRGGTWLQNVGLEEGAHCQALSVSKRCFGKERMGREPAEGSLCRGGCLSTMTLVFSGVYLTWWCVSVGWGWGLWRVIYRASWGHYTFVLSVMAWKQPISFLHTSSQSPVCHCKYPKSPNPITFWSIRKVFLVLF